MVHSCVSLEKRVVGNWILEFEKLFDSVESV